MINEPIRVLQVFGVMDRGGAENMIMNLYRNIDRKKIQFDFIVHKKEKGAFDNEIIALGGKIYHCPEYSFKGHFAYKKWWDSFFKDNTSYKIIHSHIRSTASIFLRISKKHGLVSIVHSHSTSNGKGFKSLVKRILQSGIKKYADYFFACSIASGEWLFGKKIVESNRFYFLKNAIDVKSYRFNQTTRNSVRSSLSISTNDIVFIHIGRFHESKNHIFLIKVFDKIHRHYPNSKLLLVGDGSLKNAIVKQTQQLGLSKDVIFAGLRSDVPNLLMAADCFLFPSKWEGLPVTVIEAQASGLPCIVSENITKDVSVSNSIVFLPINRGIDIWSDYITNLRLKRLNNVFSIKSSGYDVKETSVWLESFYIKIYEKVFN